MVARVGVAAVLNLYKFWNGARTVFAQGNRILRTGLNWIEWLRFQGSYLRWLLWYNRRVTPSLNT